MEVTLNRAEKEKFANLVKIMSEDEAYDVIISDRKIDKGEKLFELNDEQKKVAKSMTKTGTRKTPTVYKFENGRQVKANPTKEGIISALFTFLNENGYENVEITNKNRQIAFKIGEKAFELTLVEKRKPKS